jgi:hypothetical protein
MAEKPPEDLIELARSLGLNLDEGSLLDTGTQARIDASPAKNRRKRVVLSVSGSVTKLSALPTELTSAEASAVYQVSEKLVDNLISAQFRTAVYLTTLVLGLLIAVPTACLLWPTFATLHLLGIPVVWIALGVLPFPLFFGIGLWYNKVSEQREQDFIQLVES